MPEDQELPPPPPPNPQDNLPQDSAKPTKKESKNYRDAVSKHVDKKDVKKIVKKERKEEIK